MIAAVLCILWTASLVFSCMALYYICMALYYSWLANRYSWLANQYNDMTLALREGRPFTRVQQRLYRRFRKERQSSN